MASVSRSIDRDLSPRGEGRARSRSPSVSRSRSRSRSATPRSDYSRQPSIHDPEARSVARSPRRNGRYRSLSRSPSRDRSRTRSRTRSRSRSRSHSESPSHPLRSTKIVVERLTKNVNEGHLREIFGQYGEIEDLDLPLNRQSGTNRGTAYILYVREPDAEAAIAHMHEAQIDGAVINVSIVLPRRKFSPSPPTARRGANFDPRNPPPAFRGGPSGAPFGGPSGSAGRGRRASPPAPGSTRYGPRSDTYRPRSLSRSRSRSPLPPPASGSRRYRSRSRSYSSRSRSRTPPARGGRGGGGGRGARNGSRRDADQRSPSRGSFDDYERRSRSRSRDWDRR
ncbi:hypothetical protein B0T19DRAFT_413415 [Cercophora scortea]|uniref:RRM domain-containing protein n=1 Tax=Cercophora scortea TaxID=314031 RepID=A0AAE0MM69_9PEZI|nr:hypothetical protein B0T19DRAFT_413415 [Cercophora scortea]